MKKILFLTALVCSTALGSNIYAQQTPPPGAGDKDMRNTDVKRRSIELERVDRDARKPTQSPQTKATQQAEDKLAVKYADIKIDYEQIQISQDAVVKTYQGAGKIDYAQIGKSALEINASATRLSANLFPAPPVEPADAKTQVTKKEETNKPETAEKSETEKKSAKSVRDLIVELDNAVGSFATSPMFQNLRVVDAAVSAKTELDLKKIIELSALLNAEALRMSSGK